MIRTGVALSSKKMRSNTTLVRSMLLCFTMLVLTLSAKAQQPGKSVRIGLLEDGRATANTELLEAFRQQMAQLGWFEGKNLIIEYRFGEGKGAKQLAVFAAELVQMNVDVLVVTATSPTLAAKKATSTIPIVMTSVGDPVGQEIIASLARPGGNITGLASLTSELGGKRLEILKDAFPRATLVGILMGSRKGPGGQRQVKAMKAAGVGLGLTLEEFGATGAPQDTEKTFRILADRLFHAFITTSGPEILATRKRIVLLARKYRLPGIFPQKEFVQDGGLMAYGVDRRNQYRQAAVYVDKILKGAKPADLPVEQPTKFEFVINLKTAKHVGFTIPPHVLARADRVIK